MNYTNMRPQHVAQVAALEKLCFSDPWSEASIASELQNELSLWLVALEGEQVAGYVGSQTVLGETDMMNIAVHPDFRHQGIAAGLIAGLIGELRLRGSRCLTLEVRASNAPARNLYGKLGFRQVGLRKNYYHNPKEDGLILRKEWEI
ncbi:MAG: ribosomal protein S18-alanine N-acetyltransferase [Faecousia sp.]